jgi:hypothetical protein
MCSSLTTVYVFFFCCRVRIWSSAATTSTRHERLRDIADAGNKLPPSGSVLVSVESVIHACKFPLSTAKYTLSSSAFFYFKACTAGLVFFSKKNYQHLLPACFLCRPLPPDRGVRLCSASLINNCMLCIADEISTLNLNERAFCPLLLFEAHTALRLLVYELIFSQ